MLTAACNNNSIVNVPFEPRRITHVFHDIDGTHSLIREWPPVMSAVLYDTIQNGLPDGYDSPENIRRLIDFAGGSPLEETDRFCVESAGLSALTQMEWAIRRSLQEGHIRVDCDKAVNDEKIAGIWQGEELFESPDSPALERLLTEHTPRLFRLYEAVLNGYCRDKNLEKARHNPAQYLVAGSLEWMAYLKKAGAKNYFVTGAVVEKGMGMYEEVEALGYTFGGDGLVEEIYGSTWDKKIPKDTIIRRLAAELGVEAEQILIVGDGRSEIAVGTAMGALTLSRLDSSSEALRIHRSLGTNMIVENYLSGALFQNLYNDEEYKGV